MSEVPGNAESVDAGLNLVPEAEADDGFVEERDEEHGEQGEVLPCPPPVALDSTTSAATGRTISIQRVEKNLPRVSDHFSLAIPSSTVRFRRSNVRVYEQKNSQFVLEETVRSKSRAQAEEGGEGGGGGGSFSGSAPAHDVSITVKQMKHSLYGLTALRAVYTLVSIFMGGFLFIFCLALLMFIFMDLAAEVGATKTQDLNVFAFISVLLSVPVFVYAIGVGMAIVSRFVVDTWAGQPFLRTFGKWSVVITDWVAFTMYLGIPILTICITLFAKRDDWWALSSITWFASVTIFFGFFAACVLYYEISSTLYLLDELRPDSESSRNITKLEKIKNAILCTQRARWAGWKQDMFMVDGNMELPDGGSHTDSDEEPYVTYTGLYSRLTLWRYLACIFTKFDTPQRIWTLDEAMGQSSFVTKDSWSLEKLYCRDRHSRYVTVVKGPSAVSVNQGKSSFACAILGNILFLLIVIGILVWFDADGAFLVIVCILILLCCLPSTRSALRLFRLYQDVVEPLANESTGADEGLADEEDDAVAQNSSAIYQVYENFRVSAPNNRFCWIVCGFELIVLYLWPFIYLCVSKNAPAATLFGLLGILSGARHYLNPAIILKELGNLGSLGIKENVDERDSRQDLSGVSQKREWEAKSRLSEIVGSIGNGNSRRTWNIIFFLLVLFFVVVVISAGVEASIDPQNPDESSKTANEQMVTVEGFKYYPQPHLPYPNCQLKKGFEVPSMNGTKSESTGLLDYAFLANIAYVKSGGGSDSSQALLDQWFGDGQAIEHDDLVKQFKSIAHYGTSAVSYKFVTAANFPDFGVVSIRGTSNVWDLMADAQLWLTAGLFQGLREVLPIGSLWTPILHKCVRLVSSLESASLERVAFYKETTKFVKWLQASGNYSSIQVTGHSLGGGLALITGSQTNISAVGLSAPNAMLSRETFQPALTETQLNSLTFNIVPTRDLVAMLDDKANLYQNIDCRAPKNAFVDCHTATRSLCEIMYTCGSADRPVVCDCVRFGYPEPTPIGEDGDFTQACIEAGYEG